MRGWSQHQDPQVRDPLVVPAHAGLPRRLTGADPEQILLLAPAELVPCPPRWAKVWHLRGRALACTGVESKAQPLSGFGWTYA